MSLNTPPTSSSIMAQNRFPIATNKEAQIAYFAENTILLLIAQASHSDGIQPQLLNN